MTEQDNAHIESLEAAVENLRPVMASEMEAIIEATTEGLAAFWPKFVSECVRASGDKLARMPQDEVARIKADVGAITADPDSAARRALEQADWPHEETTGTLTSRERTSQFSGALHSYRWFPPRRQGPERGPSALDKCAKVAAAAPALPLSTAGLQTPRAGSTGEKPVEAWDFQWTDRMIRAASTYGESVKRLEKILDELHQAYRERDRNDAQAIWDEA